MIPEPHLEELILEITNACHHRCIHCSTVGGLPMQHELCQAERLRVLSEACDLGLVELRLLGGDPLYRLRDTLELLVEANRRGVEKALLYTSAVESRVEWLGTLGGLSPIRVSAEASIYSAVAEIHDSITAKSGSFERLISNSREAARVGFDLNWNFVWMKPNFTELESVVALAKEIGISRVRVLRLMLNGRARENRTVLELPDELESQCGSVINSLTDRFPEVSIASSKPLAFRLPPHNQEISCTAGASQLVVQADGHVLPCIGLKDMPQFRIGNVRSASLGEIFLRCRGSAFAQVSQEFHECPAILFQNRSDLIQLTIGRI